VKYKVSLLPEYNRKRLNNKKKLEKIKVLALTVLMVLLVLMVVVIGMRMFAEKKLNEAQALNNEYAQKVAELEQFREINANLQQKVQLIENIQVNEPALANFLATIGNLNSPGVSLDTIDCFDWKTLRTCSITGRVGSREEYLAFENALKGIQGVSTVTCTSYASGAGTTDGLASFTVSITCTGGAVIVETTQATTAETTAAE
jgi:Tfp pilus assembly protein PilN